MYRSSSARFRHHGKSRLIATGFVAAAALVLAGCSGGGGNSSNTSSGTSSSSTTQSSSGGVKALPADLQKLYTNLPSDTPVAESPWINFKPKGGPPWTIGYSSEYAGNNWRAAALTRLNEILPEYKKAGLVKNVIVRQSNQSNATQITQIKQMVDQGVDAIITCCSSTTALNGAISYAHAHDVPFFVFNGYVTSPYAISEEGNYYLDGKEMANTLFSDMDGKGSFLNVVGFPGIASNDSVEAGLKATMKKYPGISMAGSVTSLDTDAQAKQVVQEFLASHPAGIDGVFTQSPGETGVLQALQASGNKVVPITIGGETGPLCYWKNNPSWVSRGWNVWPPGDDFQAVFEMAVRTLEGQGPKIQTFIHPTVPFSHAEASAAVPAGCSTSGNAFNQPAMSDYFSQSQLDGFFVHPADPLKFKK